MLIDVHSSLDILTQLLHMCLGYLPINKPLTLMYNTCVKTSYFFLWMLLAKIGNVVVVVVMQWTRIGVLHTLLTNVA